MCAFAVAFILYLHFIPPLQAFATALLAGVSVVSIVLGLAAQNTLGNLIAGFSLVLYHPFHVGDVVQLNTPKGSRPAPSSRWRSAIRGCETPRAPRSSCPTV
jgi:small-conductance mechanosensitive channel